MTTAAVLVLALVLFLAGFWMGWLAHERDESRRTIESIRGSTRPASDLRPPPPGPAPGAPG